MGDPNRDPQTGPQADPNRIPPAAPPPSAQRPQPDADPVDRTVGPVLGTVSAVRPPAPGPNGVSGGIVWDANRPFNAYSERQTFGGADGAGVRLGGTLSQPGQSEQRLFIGTAVGGTSLGFAGDQATGAFAFGARQHNGSDGLALGYAHNPQTDTHAGYLRLDVDRLQLTGRGSVAPAGTQLGLDGRLALPQDRAITGTVGFNDGNGEWRVGLGYNGGPTGNNLSGTAIVGPRGAGGALSFDSPFGPAGSGLRWGVQGAVNPDQSWSTGGRLSLERNGWNADISIEAAADAERRLGGTLRGGVGYTDPDNGWRFRIDGNVDTRGGYGGRGTLIIPLDLSGGGGRSRQPEPRGGLTEPPELRGAPDRHSALQTPPGDPAAASPGGAGNTQALLAAAFRDDPERLAALRNHPAGEELRAQARNEADQQAAQRAQVQTAAVEPEQPDAPSRGARALG